MSVLDAVLQFTTPLSLEITVDRLCTVRALRDALRPRMPPVHLLGSEDEILLVESAHPNRSAVTRMLRDNHAMAKLNEEAVIYAYCPPATLPHQTLVFQVKIIFSLALLLFIFSQLTRDEVSCVRFNSYLPIKFNLTLSAFLTR